MKKCKITVMKMAHYDDLITKYENPIEHACDLKEGQVFIANGWQKPEGLCDSAWESMSSFVMTLAHGGEDLYDGWMKNKKSEYSIRHQISKHVQRFLKAGQHRLFSTK